MFGGIVGGKVIAASLVVVVAAIHTSPAFHRLSGDTDETEPKTNIGCTGAGGNAIESCTTSNDMSMSVYNVGSPTPLNCHIAPDVMPWCPTSRPPY